MAFADILWLFVLAIWLAYEIYEFFSKVLEAERQNAPVPVQTPPHSSPLTKPRETSRIRILEVREESRGQCQVCGMEMKEDVIHCGKCRTPHHRDCWEYAGRCSTYGCTGWERQSPNTLRAWMDEIADSYRDGHVQRLTSGPGHYSLTLKRHGIRCVLEGRRSRDERRVWFRTPVGPAGKLTPSLSLTLDDEGVVLHPREPIDTREGLRAFFAACLDVVDQPRVKKYMTWKS